MQQVDLSIIIVHYKTRELTLQCLRSLEEFRPRATFEVILVDNGSNDGIADVLSSEFPDVRFIETGRNEGFGQANNLGIVNARGRYLLLLNSDTKLIEPLWDRLIQCMEADPRVGCLGPQHVDGSGRHQVSYGKFPNLFTEILRKIVDYQIALDDLNIRAYLRDVCASEKQVDWLSGSCLLLRREALRDAGLFDGSFFMYFEDIDLCRRISRCGWKIVFCPHAKLIHYSGQSVRQNILAGLVAYRQSQINFARKHYGRPGDYMVRGLLFLKFGLIGLKALSEFAAARIFGKDAGLAYVKMLYAKKVYGMIFRRNQLRSVEPVLA
ncbi:MAG: glycosyltransferase family 2 protein [Candidatus Omnitrophica bacterium]|nr:glycosyltransferase family 2 protein [Candidatus Omnitrophota bacterium]